VDRRALHFQVPSRTWANELTVSMKIMTMETELVPDRCACGYTAVVSGWGVYYVMCTSGDVTDNDCWVGPTKKSPEQAVQAWNAVMRSVTLKK
jgi:hypothetical protein